MSTVEPVTRMRGPIVVLGDVLLDVDVLATAERLCPDGPAPVLDEQRRVVRPGGAALAALLAAVDGSREVVLVAPLADDTAARQLGALLDPRIRFVALAALGETAVKTRLRAGGHTVARLDSGGDLDIVDVPAEIAGLLGGAAAVLVSDYGTGATRDERVRALLAEVAVHVPVVWDPHPHGGEPVAGVALVTPNAAEAARAAGLGSGLAGAHRAAEILVARWCARSVAVTLGERGALLCLGPDTGELVPAPAAVEGDACGAGDCFAATAASAMAAGALPSEAVANAVAAATRYVAAGAVAGLARRTGGCTTDERRDAESAAELVARVRSAGGTVVATGGCFDLLHAGHVATLAAARSLGDCLVVCLNSDASVRRLKGAPRPLQPAADRARVLAALRAVDAVVVFEQDTPEQVLRDVRPDVWVKGGDYSGDRLPEADVVRSWGGEVITVGYLGGRSTSELVDLARQ
ncbi:MAG: D-beta-D-heptose 7-phosphate kinase / D-beta-D-heptose 1-phosphate adenosyltransferase [Pseudonocardiales bacterium]|jgi:rfaE bifunctional protein nucleotidyltransferase chain/domain|nr:D-beta-D-heptose 7-phosphate kinase / D-beta-D-heptose 1-phosphate adenosyltransferase [Pseudonocardiales bacterium]